MTNGFDEIVELKQAVDKEVESVGIVVVVAG